jgi:ABC-2 type transport system permease protein
MFFTTAHLVEAIIICITLITSWSILRGKLGKGIILGVLLFLIWAGIFSTYLAGKMTTLSDSVVVTALNKHNEVSHNSHVVIKSFFVNGELSEATPPSQGIWAYWNEGDDKNTKSFIGWVPDDKRQPEGATQRIVISLPVGRNRSITFMSYPWCGYANVEIDGKVQTIDTWGNNTSIVLAIPDSNYDAFNQNQWHQFPLFCLIYLIIFGVITTVEIIFIKNNKIDKYSKYQFLFVELVKRDFTLKYKRTILGILWSIISPLINLLIMWLVFNGILGSNVNHFVIYLFAGQLVFAYFSDATNQGMTSLLDNSSIFTKVNVPKYMFLLSKNVSSLINFALTLIVFFVFVAFEGLSFSWQYLMLIYPISFLILFNIGLGLILSALFVFFRDMQYLWGIFTQLVMWLSAIFYSIESYPSNIQKIFLLNPIYLFIRYFRKIVIENTIPSLGFHLIIAAYTFLFLIIGFRMYRKNNHEFLYYI